MTTISRLSLYIGFLLCCFDSVVNGQEKLRIIQETLHKNAPVVVVSRYIGDRLVDRTYENRNAVMARPGWVTDLSFYLKNVSNKNITYLDVDIVIPKTGKMVHNGKIITMFYGNRAVPATRPEDLKSKEGTLLPGDIVKIKISDLARTQLENYLNENDAEDVERITMDIREVHFDDGTGWQMGIELRQDPIDPKIWRSVLMGSRIRGSTSVWIAAFVPIGVFDFLATRCSSQFRQAAGIFFSAPPPPPTCLYFRGSGSPIPCTGNCTGTYDSIGCDQLPDDTLYPTAPGNIGYILTDQDSTCYPAPVQGNQATCETCSGITRDKWQDDALCGQPHTCGNISDWGCVSPLVDVNGICQRSLAYQQACEWGYDGGSCSCNPDLCGDTSDAYCYNLRGECGWYRDVRDGEICKPLSCLGCYAGGGQWCDVFGYCWTPIVIDIDGDGFALTSGGNGVWFKPSPGSERIKTAWTSQNDDDSFLVLDINGNGSIDDGSELFGCSSPQPVPAAGEIGNGFIALAEHDRPENGGNNDGQIDFRDQVFSRLKLWRDRNHDGRSEASELRRLINSDVRVIELDYIESRREDEHGNKFKYRAIVRDAQGSQVGRWAWDVFPRVAR